MDPNCQKVLIKDQGLEIRTLLETVHVYHDDDDHVDKMFMVTMTIVSTMVTLVTKINMKSLMTTSTIFVISTMMTILKMMTISSMMN